MFMQRWSLRSMVILFAVSSAVLVSIRLASAQVVPVGVAKVDITPESPVRMYGYGARKTESEGIAGRLKASALAIGADAGEGPAVLLTVDCGAVPTASRN